MLHGDNHIHIQLYTYTRGNKINNNDERTYFSRKRYLSHFIRNGCKRFCWAAQLGFLRDYSPLLGAGSLLTCVHQGTVWMHLLSSQTQQDPL